MQANFGISKAGEFWVEASNPPTPVDRSLLVVVYHVFPLLAVVINASSSSLTMQYHLLVTQAL